jgi:hypothetical protein
MNRYNLKNLWLRLTRQKMDILPGALACDYEHEGQKCTVNGLAIKQGGYLFIFTRDGRETTRIRLSRQAAESVGLLVQELPPS